MTSRTLLQYNRQTTALWVIRTLCIALIAGSFLYSQLLNLPFLSADSLTLNADIFPCMFKTLSGFPCATCGMTRSMILIARGQWALATQYNILGPALYLLAWTTLCLSFFRPDKLLHFITQFGILRPLMLLFGLLAISWWVKLHSSPMFW